MYFSWRCGREKRRSDPGQRGRFIWLTGCNFAAGSFMFWCDVIGTLTFPFEIEYINPWLRQPWELNIDLTSLGVPVSSQQHSQQYCWFFCLYFPSIDIFHFTAQRAELWENEWSRQVFLVPCSCHWTRRSTGSIYSHVLCRGNGRQLKLYQVLSLALLESRAQLHEK